MAGNAAYYRYVNYIATRVLNASELDTQQQIDRLVNSSNVPMAYELNSIYKTGALLNVQVTVSGGTNVFLTPINVTFPMLVFVRGVWEIIPTQGFALGTGTTVYLNYLVVSQVQDGTDAEMAEMQISLGLTDTSGIPNGSAVPTQLERNPSPIPLLTFTNVGGVATYVPVDQTYPWSRGSNAQSGIVSLTTGTSNGKATSSDDPVNTNQRVPTAGSVNTSKVQSVILSGTTNADGTPNVNPTATGQGGIQADHLIYVTGTQTVEAAIQSIDASVASFVAALAAHIGAPLGLTNTHPMPTYYQVGAAPISHVGSTFDNGQHVPSYTQDHIGMIVTRNPAVAPAPTDYAFLLRDNALNTIIAMTHEGDLATPELIYSSLSVAYAAIAAVPATVAAAIAAEIQGGQVTFAGASYGHSAMNSQVFTVPFTAPGTSAVLVSPVNYLGIDFSVTGQITGNQLRINILNSSFVYGYTLADEVINYKVIA
jgi:hypothetical protein